MAYEIFGRVADFVPIGRVEFKVPLQYLSEEIGVVFVVERRIPAEQYVRDDAYAPNVDGLSVRLLREHFGRDVSGRSAGGRHYARVFHFRKAEVADHDLAVFVGTVV